MEYRNKWLYDKLLLPLLAEGPSSLRRSGHPSEFRGLNAIIMLNFLLFVSLLLISHDKFQHMGNNRSANS